MALQKNCPKCRRIYSTRKHIISTAYHTCFIQQHSERMRTAIAVTLKASCPRRSFSASIILGLVHETSYSAACFTYFSICGHQKFSPLYASSDMWRWECQGKEFGSSGNKALWKAGLTRGHRHPDRDSFWGNRTACVPLARNSLHIWFRHFLWGYRKARCNLTVIFCFEYGRLETVSVTNCGRLGWRRVVW
jgi:hypothetical protein